LLNVIGDLELFYKFGRVRDIQIVIDKKTNKSRGFGFVYFEEVESATRVCCLSVAQWFIIRWVFYFQAKEALNSIEVDHHRLRIDYSVTKRAHTPSNKPHFVASIMHIVPYLAPGIYMGVRPNPYHRSNGQSNRRSPSPDRRPSYRRNRHHHDRSRLVHTFKVV
jgi:transformer-2 protein